MQIASLTGVFRRLRRYLPPFNWDFIVMAICFVAFMGITIWFVTFQVSRSQHVFCQLITTLTSVQPPSGNPAKNPSRAYDIKIADDLIVLQRNLGC